MKSFFYTALIFFTSLQLNAQCGGVFFDDFETGTLSPAWSIGTGHTVVVDNIAPAVGTYSMHSTGVSAFYAGPNVMLTSSQPTYVSVWMSTNTVTAANGYFVLGDANIVNDNGVLFAYFNASSSLRFFGTTGYNYPIVANTWYHVEAMNMNWTSRTSDIYVNGVLILPGWPFRSTTATSIDRLHTFNLTNATASYDNIIIGGIPLTLSNTATSPVCNGDATGAIDLNVSGGNAPYSYSWSNSANSQDINGVVAGTYSVTVTDNSSCVTTASFTITEPPALSLSATTTNVICFAATDGTADLTVTGGSPGYNYSWSSGASTEDEPSLAAGTYTVLVTDNNGCSGVLSGITITEPTEITAAVAVTNILCNGANNGSATVSPTGGIQPYSYLWSPAGGTSPTATGLAAGTYTCTITDTNGCVLPQTCAISEPSVITSTISGTDVNCNGGNTGTAAINVSGGTPGYSYNWLPTGGTTANATGLTAGTYTCNIIDVNGCTHSETITITEPTAIVATASSTGATCAGGSDATAMIMATGGTPGYTFSWSNGDTSATADSLFAGPYSCTVTDANGCSIIQQVIISQASPIVITLNVINATSCGGNEGSIDATVTGGTSPFTYSWSSGQPTEDIFALTFGSYVLTVTDSNGCTAVNNADVLNPPLPTVSLSFATTMYCFDDANVTLSGGSPAGGAWGGTGVSAGMFDPSAAGNGPTIITYSYTDANNCTASATNSLTVDACIGITELSSASWNIYPNPSAGIFTISTSNSNGDVLFEIVDVQGRVVLSENATNSAPGFSRQLSLENVSNGLYMLRISNVNNGIVETYKLSIQH